MRLLIPSLAVLLGFSSCTYEQKIHFKNDQSGTFTTVIDMSEMMNSLPEMEEEESEEEKSMFDSPEMMEALEELRQKEGVSNVRVIDSDQKGVFSFAMDFNDLKVLNQADVNNGPSGMAGNTAVADAMKEHTWYKINGKKFIYDMPQEVLQKMMNTPEMEDLENSPMINLDMYKFKLTFTFDKEIKKIKGNKTAEIHPDRKGITQMSTFADLVKGNADLDLTIIFKEKFN